MPPKIDKKKCQGCGSCVNICPQNVLELKGKVANVARPKNCLECRACEATCPNNAISF